MATALTATEASDRTAIPVLEIGRAWMMDPACAERGAGFGLRPPFGFWAVGRAGAMGEVSAEVAAAAIGFMAPGRVAEFWSERAEGVSSRAVAEALGEHAADFGRRVFADLDDVDLARCAELVHTVTSAALPSLGVLFAAWRTIPVPADPAGAATVELQVLREMRGGAHLSAATVVGLGPHGVIMSFIADQIRGGAGGAERFGWEPPHPEPDVEARGRAEALTTAACVPAFEALSAAERGELVDLVLLLRSTIDI